MASASANYRGIQYLLIAVTCLSINDACNKFVVATLPVSEIVTLRAILTGSIVIAVMGIRGEFASLRLLGRPDVIVRGVVEAWIGPLIIISLAFMHQADVTSIYLVAPVFVALVGFGHFREQFSWWVLLASAIALAGAWLFVDPGGGVFQTVALLPLAASGCQVLREVISLRMGIKAENGAAVSHAVVQLSTTLFSLVAGAILAMFFSWATPVAAWKWPDATEFSFIVAASVLFYLGVMGMYEAYRASDLSVVAPFRYWYLLVAIIIGYLVFGEVPTMRSFVGMATIVIAGIIVIWWQSRVRRA